MNPRENILLIRLKSIGDILFTLPAVHVVRENFPDAKLYFLVSKEYAPLIRGFSEIDEVIPLDRAIYRPGNWKAAISSTFQLLRRLREENFSLAVDFQGYGETELLAWWSGAPERWGSVYHPTRGWTYTRTLLRGKKAHQAEQNLALLRHCGLSINEIRNEYHLPAEALDEGRRFFTANKLDENKPTLFIQPFTSSSNKNWPLENFLHLAMHWRSHDVQILFGGGPSERAALEPAHTADFCIAAGTSLLVCAGLMKLSTLVVGGDTGLLHLAVAMGKRVVMIMNSNKPGASHPFQYSGWTITPPSGKVVSEIQTTAVIETCQKYLFNLDRKELQSKFSSDNK
jgi:ADP-heptose:LPS heptosyltransferase